MRLFALDASQVDATWEDYAHHFERFERKFGDITASQIKDAALSGAMQIWGLQDDDAVHAVVATEVCRTAGAPLCVIRIACGGARVAMQERLLDEIGKWASQEQGCERIRIYGRVGWLRRFRRFRMTGVIAEWQLKVN